MASGVEIFIIVFILLLVITGIILAIYFVWRNDQKKRDSVGGNGGNSGATGTTGATGATGTTGPPQNQNFSMISALSPNPKFVATTGQNTNQDDIIFALNLFNGFGASPCADFYFQYKNVTRNGVNIPNAIEVQNSPFGRGIVYFDSDNILKYDKNNDIPTSGIPGASWIFKDGKICLQSDPDKCMFISGSLNPPPADSIILVSDSTSNPNALGFQWNTSLVVPADGCTA